MRSAFVPSAKERKKPTCHIHPCMRKRAVSHHVFRRVQTCPLLSAGPAMGKGRCGVVVRRGNRRALAYPPRWGALMNAASSVLPMVRFPLADSKPLLSAYRVFSFFAFLLTGAMGAIFHSPPVTTKPSMCAVRVCVCCLCIAGAGVKSLARLLTSNRHTPLRAAGLAACSQSHPPAPVSFTYRA